MPPDAVVGGRIADERHKDFISELPPGESAPYSISSRSAAGSPAARGYRRSRSTE